MRKISSSSVYQASNAFSGFNGGNVSRVLGLAVATIGLWAFAGGGASAQPAQAQASFTKGRTLADEALRQQQAPDGLQLLADREPVGYLIAEGDSWFDYPGLDVIGALEGQTLPNRDYYRIYSAAHAGDNLESMAYDSNQLKGLAKEFKKVVDAGKQGAVKAVLLSGGGNDIAGDEFGILLNHAKATATTRLDNAMADALIQRLGRAMESLIGTVSHYANAVLGIPRVRVVIHGYAEPVPDGRPYGIGWIFPGPWLQPGFVTKGYAVTSDADLELNAKVMSELINRYNERLTQIPANLSNLADVKYVDVRPLLKNVVPASVYKGDWSNELHPTNAAFKRVAEAMHAAIQQP